MRTEPYLGSSTTLKDRHQARPWIDRVRTAADASVLSKLTILVVLVGVARIALRPAELQHDVAMYLQAGELLLRGQRPYVDFIDVNPPLIVYLSAIPAGVAATLHAPIAPTALLLTATAAALSLVAVRRHLLDAFRVAGDPARLAEVAVLALALAFFLSDLPERIDVPFPGNASADPRLSAIFAQREHLFLIGAMPFLALRLRRWQGGEPRRRDAIVTGVIASVVTCLKPQLVVALLAFELALAQRRRLGLFLAPEVVAFILGVVAYGAHFALLPDAVRAAWFGRWLPFIVQGYGVFDEPSYGDLALRCAPAVLACVVAYGVSLRNNATGQKLIHAFASMAVAGAALYVGQKKGWTYQAFPERVASFVALSCSAVGVSTLVFKGEEGGAVLLLSRRRLDQVVTGLVVMAAVVCAACLVGIDTPKDVDRLRRRSQVMRTIDTFTKEGDAVLVATTSVWDPYPALTLQNRLPGSRYLWLFPIPMMQASTRGGAEGDFVRDLADDIRERKPTLLLLQTGRCFGCKKTSVDAFFREHPPLASLLQDYSLRGTVHDGQELQVFVRTP